MIARLISPPPSGPDPERVIRTFVRLLARALARRGRRRR